MKRKDKPPIAIVGNADYVPDLLYDNRHTNIWHVKTIRDVYGCEFRDVIWTYGWRETVWGLTFSEADAFYAQVMSRVI